MQNAKMTAKRTVTQFQLTQNLLNNLQQFNITPTAKLVLLYLSSCYNPKHAEMFPKQRTIADKLGVSEASVIRAICDLHKEGLIISERKYTNRYKYTPKFLISLGILDNKMQVENSQNESKETCNLQSVLIEPKKKHKKEPIGVDDYKILKDYAIKHNARNINAYINALKQSGSAEKILREHKQVSERYYTGEVERIEAIKREVIQKLPQEYFDNIRKRFGLTPSAPLKGGTGLCI